MSPVDFSAPQVTETNALSKVCSILGRKVAIRAHTGKYLGRKDTDGIVCACNEPKASCEWLVFPTDDGHAIFQHIKTQRNLQMETPQQKFEAKLRNKNQKIWEKFLIEYDEKCDRFFFVNPFQKGHTLNCAPNGFTHGANTNRMLHE